MTRPLVWALGTLATAALSFAMSGDRLAQRFLPAQQETLSTATASGGALVTVAADLAGHFVVHPQVEGRRLRMLVDTGASMVALTYEDAYALGLKLDPKSYTRKVTTANGVVAVAPVRLKELRVGAIVVRNVDAAVVPKGLLGTSLLGMSFLKRIDGFEISGGRLTLRG